MRILKGIGTGLAIVCLTLFIISYLVDYIVYLINFWKFFF